MAEPPRHSEKTKLITGPIIRKHMNQNGTMWSYGMGKRTFDLSVR
jgi:hypothetical protein